MTLEEGQIKPWIPNKPVSEGATAYHDAVVDAEYYVEALQEYVKLAKDQITEGDVVVEFGAGTGVSAIQLLKHVKVNFKLWLVDNSAAWLGKAHSVFENKPNVQCYLLKKIQDRYATLAETIGEGVADKVLSANTVHLIPDIGNVFKGIENSLKPEGIFAFMSGNIDSEKRDEGVLLVDDTVGMVHDVALDIVREDERFSSYREDLDKQIEKYKPQRSFVFPEPRSLEFYVTKLKEAGLKLVSSHCKELKFRYDEWLAFLRVKRLQAGILPEIGGMEPSAQEEKDRDDLITRAAKKVFKNLEETNPRADDVGFTVDSVYVIAQK